MRVVMEHTGGHGAHRWSNQPPINHKIHTLDTEEIRVVKYCFQWSGSIAAPIEPYGATADALTVAHYR